MNSAVRGIEGNLEKIESFVAEASREGADMICFPELSVSGYTLREPNRVCHVMDRETVLKRLARTARDAGLLIVAGFIEAADRRKPYITQVVAGPQGLMGFYRKTHLSPSEEKVYQAGSKIRVFSHRGTSFGIQLCYEAHFPEISTVMALMGVDILIFPHASPRGDPQTKLKSWLRHLPGRAFDNGVFVVACNQVGETGEGFSFPGVALILGPDGMVLDAYAGNEEKILYGNLGRKLLEDTRQNRMKYFLPKRIPGLYGKIVES
jgi:predicted amidohydrolase